MSPPLVKICGVARAADADDAVAAGADYLGMIFFERSPRYVSQKLAADIHKAVAGRVPCVAVTVDVDDEALDRIAPFADIIQCHGRETPARLAELAKRGFERIWKALSVRTGDEVIQAQAYGGLVERILFDTKAPEGASRPGGHGVAFDWTLLGDWRTKPGWGLAGGLTPDNVDEAVRFTRAPLVDAASGVERQPGIKDPVLLHRFIAAAKQAHIPKFAGAEEAQATE
ncbi:MAG: phosphoribosylanthranilate isomerase [Geminicoccaceae bacterium]